MDPSALKPPGALAHLIRTVFPGASAEYETARRALFVEEVELRRHETRVAAQRRALPPGPAIEKDYRFIDANGSNVGLIDLFGNHDTLVTYFWMFGPQRERPCPMCTAWIGAVNGNGTDIAQKVSLRIIGRSPIERQLAFAQERGWRNVQFVETVGDDYPRDLGVLPPDGGEWPALVVYRKDGPKVRLFYMAQMPGEAADPGQDARSPPEIQSLWNILDLTPEGRGTEWYPKLSY